ncbi:MAG: DUF5009 domain-containing protein [Muribaculaceae bacterium]
MIDNNRAYSLDALRGYAIITMVLSGQIVFGILPGWMYHGQTPPPTNQFNPEIFGITWVDLVFPFFLFAMGAAFPLSLGKKIERGVSKWKLTWSSIERCLKLTFFAIFIQHLYPFSTSNPQDVTSWILAISAFCLMFLMFMRLPIKMPEFAHRAVELSAFGVGIAMMLSINYPDNKAFSLLDSNIIILVLANMALFGSLIYLFTIKSWIARVAVLPFIMAVLIGGATEGSWVQSVINYSPAPWMYQFRFLKYLFIVIPGSIAGGYLVTWMAERKENKAERSVEEKRYTPILLILCVGLIVFNLYGLYTRQLILNLGVTVAILCAMYLMLRADSVNVRFWKKLFVAGAYLLMLGLFFEAYEGGIRKDNSTFSYYFVTSGLAFIALMGFSIMCDVYRWKKVMSPLVMAGQNPMIAYVATSLLIWPLLNLIGVASYFSVFESNPWLGFLKGVILTSLAVLVAMLFTKIKWFWRT